MKNITDGKKTDKKISRPGIHAKTKTSKNNIKIY